MNDIAKDRIANDWENQTGYQAQSANNLTKAWGFKLFSNEQPYNENDFENK